MILNMEHTKSGSLVSHLFFCVEGVEVVVISELNAAVDVLESKETNSVNAVHGPKREKNSVSC